MERVYLRVGMYLVKVLMFLLFNFLVCVFMIGFLLVLFLKFIRFFLIFVLFIMLMILFLFKVFFLNLILW